MYGNVEVFERMRLGDPDLGFSRAFLEECLRLQRGSNQQIKTGDDPTKFPLADDQMTPVIFQLLKQALKTDQVEIGPIEAIKALNKNMAELIVIAADTDPLDKVLLYLQFTAQDQRVPFVFIEKKEQLRQACGVTTTACSLTGND